MRDLPRDLPETFERILSKYTETNDIDLGRQIFGWVSVAKRPLTVEELREAMGIRPLQEAWDDSTYINDMKKAVACCGNLIFIEEEQQTVHFTHSSVKQYLLSSAVQESTSKYHVDLEKADEDAGAICVTYLNFPVFNRQVARTTGKSVSNTGITSTVIQNSLPLGQSGNKIALRFLRLKQDKKSGKSVNRLLEQVAGDTEVYRQQQTLRHYSFRPYATQFWLEHTKQGISPDSKQLWGLWCNLIMEASWWDTLFGLPWTSDDLKKRSPKVIQWIVEQNHCSLAQLFIGSDKGFNVRLTQQNLSDFVLGAAMRGYAQLIAITLGSKLVSQMMLDSGLKSAVEGGHLDAVERLLQEKADVNYVADQYHVTTLQAAAGGGHLEVVERLLQANADINATTVLGRTALQAAARGGHLNVVKRLLQANADINTNSNYGTALQIAARGGHLNVVKRLLQANADINTNSNYGTALQAAAGRGHLEIVERLLQANANVNAKARGKTALQIAAQHGHLEMVERLLQANADVNAAAAAFGITALRAAARGGHLEVVERLLQADADVNAADEFRRTALQEAAEGGHLEVVERLRAAGAKD